MIKEIKDKFPKWCEDTKDYDLLLSDDIDSLMCAMFQKQYFNREIKYFIDVNYKKCAYRKSGIQKMYIKENHIENKDNMLGLDIALEEGKTWDNHVTKIYKVDNYNKNSANINNIRNINKYNYTDKYVISSYITMLSYYNIDISKWSYEQLCVLCAIDGLYTPFETERFKTKATKNLVNDLEYGFLADFITENIEDIKRIEQELNLKEGKIKVKDGKLVTNIKLDKLSEIFGYEISLPTFNFNGLHEYSSKIINTSYADVKDKLEFFNFVLLYKSSCIQSVKIK